MHALWVLLHSLLWLLRRFAVKLPSSHYVIAQSIACRSYAFLIIIISLLPLQKWRLTQSLNVSCSCLNSSSTENCQKFQSALSATCRLYEANKILPNINLPDNTTQQVLEIMSEKGVQDACIWVNETLRQVNPQAGLPSEVVCSNVSTLDSLCSQWSEVTSIMRIEAKVDLLGASIEEDKWFESHNDLTRAELYSGC